MAVIPQCPTCARPLVVATVGDQQWASCPNCGARSVVTISASGPENPGEVSWAPRAGSRHRTSRKRGPRSSVTVMASIAGAGMVCAGIVILALIASQPRHDDLRAVAASTAGAGTRKPLPDAKVPSRTVNQRGTASDHRARPATTEDASSWDSSDTASAAAGDAEAGEPEPMVPEAKSEGATRQTDAELAAIADSLAAAQRRMTSESKEAFPKSEGERSPRDYQMPNAAKEEEQEKTAELSPDERRRAAEIAKLKRLIQRRFTSLPRTNQRSRGLPDDYFVVAKYEMPMATRVADVRFEVTHEIEPSVEQVADYLVETPTSTLRDFQVVARFSSTDEATSGIEEIRQRYDRAREYQAQFLAYLQAQQRFQAQSVRRC